jgi:hypothetical protein
MAKSRFLGDAIDSRMRIKTTTYSDVQQKPGQFYWYGLLRSIIVKSLPRGNLPAHGTGHRSSNPVYSEVLNKPGASDETQPHSFLKKMNENCWASAILAHEDQGDSQVAP